MQLCEVKPLNINKTTRKLWWFCRGRRHSFKKRGGLPRPQGQAR